MKKIFLLAVAFLGLAFFIKSLAQTDNHKDAEAAATLASQAWLKIIDAEDYAKSYLETGKIFQSAVTNEKWISSITPIRKQMGKLIARENFSTTYTTTVPGAPDGEYVILQFKTSFANKKEATETVSVVKENGSWKVVGYFIK